MVHYIGDDKAPKGKYRIMGVHLGMDYFPEEDHSSKDEAFKRCRELNKIAKKNLKTKYLSTVLLLIFQPGIM